MKPAQRMTHEFVDSVPATLEPGVVYVTIRHNTVLHLCCCDCGEEVETPLSPAEWSLTYDGENISLYPSIGNSGLGCKSHYWITEGQVKWANKLSDEDIAASQASDSHAFQKHITAGQGDSPTEAPAVDEQTEPESQPKKGFFAWIRKIFKR